MRSLIFRLAFDLTRTTYTSAKLVERLIGCTMLFQLCMLLFCMPHRHAAVLHPAVIDVSTPLNVAIQVVWDSLDLQVHGHRLLSTSPPFLLHLVSVLAREDANLENTSDVFYLLGQVFYLKVSFLGLVGWEQKLGERSINDEEVLVSFEGPGL